MAQFNSGIKFDSDVTAGNTTPSSATFAQLRGNLANGTDATTNDNDFLATQAGAMVLSLRPDVQSSAKTVSLIEGKFVDVSMEYSNDGASVRFLIKAEGSTTVPTAYVAAGAGHTLALSYDAKNGGGMFYALDGVGAAVPGAFGANFDADSTSNKSVVFAKDAGFDGHLSALAFFQEHLSQAEVTRLSNDPESWITSLSTYNAPQLNWPVKTYIDAAGSGAPLLTGLLGGNATATLEPATVTGQGVQVLTIKTGLVAGDKISLSVPNAGYSAQTYTVLASDLSAADPLKTIATNLVKSMQGKLGTDVILNYGTGINNAGGAVANTGTVVITGANDFLLKPVVLKYTNTAEVTESALQYLYDFRLVSPGATQQSLTAARAAGLDPNSTNSGALADGNARVELTPATATVTFDKTPTATSFTGASTTSTAGAVSNGPIYAQIKSIATANSERPQPTTSTSTQASIQAQAASIPSASRQKHRTRLKTSFLRLLPMHV